MARVVVARRVVGVVGVVADGVASVGVSGVVNVVAMVGVVRVVGGAAVRFGVSAAFFWLGQFAKKPTRP